MLESNRSYKQEINKAYSEVLGLVSINESVEGDGKLLEKDGNVLYFVKDLEMAKKFQKGARWDLVFAFENGSNMYHDYFVLLANDKEKFAFDYDPESKKVRAFNKLDVEIDYDELIEKYFGETFDLMDLMKNNS